MLLDSSSRCPVAPVTLTRSDPAKSTKFNFPTLMLLVVSFRFFLLLKTSVIFIYSTIIMNTACDQELTSFILVAAVALFHIPSFIRL